MSAFRKLITLTYTLFLFFHWNSVDGQHYYTRNITTKDGLPSNKIQDIFKDSRGYMWIGTDAGLCRFDGINYKTYTQNDGLVGNWVWSITEDTNGNIWVACYGNGISMFNGKTFKNFSEKDGLINNNVRKIEYSKKHKGLMIGTVYGFSFFKDSIFTSFKDSTVTKRNLLQVTAFLETDTSIYLFTYYDNEQFIEFKPKTGTFRYLNSNHRYHFKSTKSTCCFINSKKDTLIGYYLTGIKTYTKDSINVNSHVGQIFDIAEDKNGDLWLASFNDGDIPDRKSKGGIYRFRDNIEEYYNDKLGISSQQCWSLYYDKNENLLWIGTMEEGIYLYSMSGIEYTPAKELNPQRASINDIFIDYKKQTWLSVGDRIIKKGKNSKVFTSNEFQPLYNKFAKEHYAFLNDKEGSYEKYQGLIEKGLYKFINPYIRLYNDSIIPKGRGYNPDNYKVQQNKRVTEFYTFGDDLDGKVCITSNAGFYKIDCNENNIYTIPTDNYSYRYFFESGSVLTELTSYELYSFAINNSVFTLKDRLFIRKNTTWSSSVNYLRDKDFFWLYSNTDGVSKYQNGKQTKFPYLENQIDLGFTALCLDSSKHLIAGTNTGKIYILNYRNDSLKVINKVSLNTNLTGAEVSWLLVDKHNFLWIGTNKGLNAINLTEFYKVGKAEVKYFNNENGYFDYNTTKAILDSTGVYLLVISKDNHIRINPDELIQSLPDTSKLVLDRIDINFKEFDWKSIGRVEKWTGLPENKIELPYTSNTLAFYFHLLQYLEPSKARYSYKLEGVQNDWSPYTTESKVILTNLSPDKYRLVVRGMVISNPNNVSELEIIFTIRPPWWLTWWFYSGLVVLGFLLMYLIFKNRLKLANEKSRIDQRVSELKLEALKAQMNPHFIFNAFTSIQLYILQNDTKNALDYMGRFAKLIRMTLDNSTKKKIQLSEELSFLENYLLLEQRRLSNLNYTFVVEPDIDTDEIMIPPMLLQPLIENSIMHGIRHLESDGRITVEFKKEEDHLLRCIVEDNGIGRVKSKEIYSNQQKTHESRSTEITEERIKLLNSSSGDANIQLLYTDLCENGKSTGTRVELLISV